MLEGLLARAAAQHLHSQHHGLRVAAEHDLARDFQYVLDLPDGPHWFELSVARKVMDAMAWAGVAHLRDNDPATLSGGEKQRVALARARVLEAKLLLLDEPTANLDGAAREQVMALIPALINAGSTVVMACHDRDLIGLAGVQRLKLRDGKLEYK